MCIQYNIDMEWCSKIPKDILHMILEYNGTIKYRNGKYINRISRNDDRYNILQRIPNINTHYHNNYFISIYNRKFFLIKKKDGAFLTGTAIELLETNSNKYEFSYDGFYYKWSLFKAPIYSISNKVYCYIRMYGLYFITGCLLEMFMEYNGYSIYHLIAYYRKGLIIIGV